MADFPDIVVTERFWFLTVGSFIGFLYLTGRECRAFRHFRSDREPIRIGDEFLWRPGRYRIWVTDPRFLFHAAQLEPLTFLPLYVAAWFAVLGDWKTFAILSLGAWCWRYFVDVILARDRPSREYAARKYAWSLTASIWWACQTYIYLLAALILLVVLTGAAANRRRRY